MKRKRKNDTPKGKIKGTLIMTNHTLKKPNLECVYKCRMCTKVVKSARVLSEHHQKKHGIMYCKYCKRPFNNQLSLSRHLYEHTLDRKFVCSKCNLSFPFKSQLTYYKKLHVKHSTHFCIYPNCNWSFKNQGDLNRHAKSHTIKAYECPDCEYSHVERRNYDLHLLTHNDIKRHFCPQCEMGFQFNTQKRRHINENECAHKRSGSPEY